jgi:hypothetical protein
VQTAIENNAKAIKQMQASPLKRLKHRIVTEHPGTPVSDRRSCARWFPMSLLRC